MELCKYDNINNISLEHHHTLLRFSLQKLAHHLPWGKYKYQTQFFGHGLTWFEFHRVLELGLDIWITAKLLKHIQLQHFGNASIFKMKSPKKMSFTSLQLSNLKPTKWQLSYCVFILLNQKKKFLQKSFQVYNENFNSFPILTSKYSKGLLLCSKFYSKKKILNRSPLLWGILNISWHSFLMDLSRKLILRSIIE